MKVAVMTSRFPYPIEKGDKLRAYQHIRHLSRSHEIHLFALSHTEVPQADVQALANYCASIQIFRLKRWKLPLNVIRGLLNGLPVQVSYFFDNRLKRKVQTAIIQAKPDHIFTQLLRTSEYVRNLPFVKTLDYMDTFSYGAQQRSRSGNVLLRPFFAIEKRLLKRYERAIYSDFHGHTVISAQDRDRLPLAYQRGVTILPNGVDTSFYSGQSAQVTYDLGFVGNMGYLPNIEAAEYLVNAVMPGVWRARPETTVVIVGARPHHRVRRLASERVKVTGWVDDVREYYQSVSLFVAPMQSGMGLQNKVLEAMSMSRACVTTTIVNNAIGAQAGRDLEVADHHKDMTARILALLNDQDRRNLLAQNARAFVTANYHWDQQNKILDQLLYKHRKIERNQTNGSTDRHRASYIEYNQRSD